MRKFNLTETVIDVFDDCNWNPITIQLPQSEEKLTLIPEFYTGKTPCRSTVKGLKVIGGCIPISGTIADVCREIRRYDKNRGLRRRLNQSFR